MIIYLSGFSPKGYYNIGKKLGIKNYLYSFHTHKKKKLQERYQTDYKLFMDSGGYSARVSGVKVDINEYADYLNANAQYIEVAANLDTNDVKETLANQALLLSKVKGVKILPVYHASDYIDLTHKGLLDEFIKKFDYIGVGGMAGVSMSEQQRVSFLKYVFSKTKDKVKVHGFGITARKILEMFPFYSVDSTSWMAGFRYGQVMSNAGKMFSYKDRKKVFDNNILHSSVAGNHFDKAENDLTYWVNLEKDITRLWNKKGVIWKK